MASAVAPSTLMNGVCDVGYSQRGAYAIHESLKAWSSEEAGLWLTRPHLAAPDCVFRFFFRHACPPQIKHDRRRSGLRNLGRRCMSSETFLIRICHYVIHSPNLGSSDTS
ncbi:uncharacterized protein [Physcomitrium patens]|uniref:Uncharacterized protein n=1 Tax=Physcomitrium patens TaxID=3218 RepID=A0A2K1IR84_PHYPA|nr:uncharacterized protein LOC112274085 [Physcomitrium patens]PNR31790.1 hypothetical protein PHYPA_025913 [Physcomitrium patens]|eukprot:XP_024359012.1 uncharacterized protein LOC112274085 [Physcomitrella patens]